MISSGPIKQLPLPFGTKVPELPLQVGAFNKDALEAIRAVLTRPSGRGPLRMVSVVGPSGAGKTRLLRSTAHEAQGHYIIPDAAGALDIPDTCEAVFLDHAEQADPMVLFATYNAMARADRAFIIAGDGPPHSWGSLRGTQPPDLISRLSSITPVRVDLPEEVDVIAAIHQLLDSAGLRFSQEDIAQAVEGQLRRRFDAAEAYGAAVIAQSVGDGPFGKGLLKASVADIPQHRL